MQELTEGRARFYAESREIVSADMGVFYNPAMRANRDLSLLAIAWLAARGKPVRALFPMAASGVRPLRVIEELGLPAGSRLFVNDISERATQAQRDALELNERAASSDALVLSTSSALSFLASSKLADYVEVDPFGSPLEFLDTAIQRVRHRGVLSVTATDTAALCGTYPKTGLRKYQAFTQRSPLMHEHAVRILAHVVERNAARYAKAARLIFADAHEHYVKLFFELTHSKSESARLVTSAEFWTIDATGYPTARASFVEGRPADAIGPLSAQPLYDASFLDLARAPPFEIDPALAKRLDTIRAESSVGGFAIDLHRLASELGLEHVPRVRDVLERLGPDRAARTVFCETAIRTTASRAEVIEAMRA